MRGLCSIGLMLTAAALAPAQGIVPADRPTPAAPAPRADASTTLYALGVMQKRQERYLDAIRTLEECRKVDPESAAPCRMLAGLYRIVGRMEDALACTKIVVEKHPEEFEGWRRHADLLHEMGKPREAILALEKAAACPSAADSPDQWLLALQRLSTWAQKVEDFPRMEAANRKLLAVLEKNSRLFRETGFLSDDEQRGERADALELAGRAAMKQNRLTAAANDFNAAFQLYAQRTDDIAAGRRQRLHFNIAELCDAQGDRSRALEHLDSYLKAKPQSVEPYKFLVEVMKRAGLEREIPRRLDGYAQRDKGFAPLRLLLAEHYAAVDQFHEAQTAFLTLLREQPKTEYYRGLLGLYHKHQRLGLALEKLDEHLTIAEDQSKSEEARELANQHARAMYAVLKDHPAMIRALIPLSQEEYLRQLRHKMNLNYKTFDILGRLASLTDELEAAERLFREAAQRMGFPGLRAHVDEPLIQVLLARRKYADVVELCESRLRTTEHNQFMYTYYKAFPEARTRGLERGLGTAEQAIELAHNDDVKVSARIQKIDILLWGDDTAKATDEARQLLREAASIKQVRRARLTMARVFSAARQHALAEAELRRVLDTDPNDAQANNDLGYQLADQGRKLDEAERLIRRALELDRAERQQGRSGDEEDAGEQDNPAYLDSLGWVLFRRGQLPPARAALEKAATLRGGKDDPTVWDHLGDVRFRQGEMKAAQAAWNMAIKLYEQDRRSKKDGRFDDLKRKLQLSDPR